MGRAKGGIPSAWVTWLTGLLSGEDHCVWSAWFRARYWFKRVEDPTFDSVQWNAAHSALVERRAGELRAAGWAVYLENQNDFRVDGQTAGFVGKPDIVAVNATTVRVVDAKSGQRYNKHWWQIACYLRYIRRVFPTLCAGKIVEGEICYAEGDPVVVPESDLTPELMERLNELMKQIGFDMPPPKTPSVQECRFCSIPATECPDRIEAAAKPVAATVDF